MSPRSEYAVLTLIWIVAGIACVVGLLVIRKWVSA